MLTLLNLDADTRNWMLAELEHDLSSGQLYLSKRFSDAGRRDYPDLLRQALESHNDDWLAAQLRLNGRLADRETYERAGKTHERAVPVNAAETLAEGEFNRFYLRALARRVLETGKGQLIVYRAKPVSQPRPESEQMIGTPINPEALLNDLRKNVGVDTALKLPPGPNSGLSAKLA